MNNLLCSRQSGFLYFLCCLSLLLTPFSAGFADTLTWTEQETNTTRTLWSVMAPDSLNCYAVGDGGTRLRTHDGGNTWQRQSSSGSYRAVYFANCSTGWAADTHGNIIKTTDSGATWTNQFTDGAANLYCAWFINENTGFVAGYKSFDGIVLRTVNSGSTWTETTLNNITGIGSICFVGSNRGWVVGRDDIASTSNSGESWSSGSAITPGYINAAFFYTPLKGIGAGRYGDIVKTENGGGSWSAIQENTYDWLEDVHFPDTLHGVIVGERGIMHYSVNGGSTWREQWPRHTSSLWAPWFRAVHFTDPAHGWAVGDSGIIMKGAFIGDSSSIKKRPNAVQASNIYLNANILSDNLLGLKYTLPSNAAITIEIFNISGQKVLTLLKDFRRSGVYFEVLRLSGLKTSGVYCIILHCGNTKVVDRVVLVK